MFGSLFGDDEDDKSGSRGDQGAGNTRGSLKAPPAPRNKTRLSGLSNLGATCYLNSLLQTLHFTPEFRESLFRVGVEELGVYSEEEAADNSQVRVIPVQLQILFARLLFLDQQSCGVDGLISSFGWTNNEELQQHDVQELNRILFAAIESSLVGTAGEHLIGQLYRGTFAQQILCQSCGHVSQREEEFLDIPVPLTGRTGLTVALKEMFNETELLEGDNKYHCGNCDCLVDARRECRLKKFPPVLTFALLRFLYDFKRGERYKDTSQFKFPLELDMTPYGCGSHGNTTEGGGRGGEGGGGGGGGGGEGGGGGGGGGGERVEYELYSVVIHSGSTHSGHYTAYIRDIDNLGSWTHPDEDPVQLPSDEKSGKVDYIEFDTPTELLVTLLKGLDCSATVDRLCKSMQEKTGVTWNKRFKRQFGSIHQFLRSCPDFFVVDNTKRVSLKTTPTDTPPSPMDTTAETTCGVEQMETTAEPVEDPSPTSPANNNSTSRQCNTEHSATSTEETAVSDHGEDLSAALPVNVSMESSDSTHTEALEQVSSSTSHDFGGGSGDQSRDVGVVSKDHVAMETEGSKSKPVASKWKGDDKLKEPPPPGERWFHFNDVQVSPALVKSLEKMYQGKESAYMLFYRRKKHHQPFPGEVSRNVSDSIPGWLQAKIAAENSTLEEEKAAYDIAVNTIQLNVHLSSSYSFDNGTLHPKVDSSSDVMVTVVSINRRKTVSDLETTLEEVLPGQVRGHVISVARRLPAGMHIYDSVSGRKDQTLQDLQVLDGSNLFIWDGKQVGGVEVRTGQACEPVLLRVTYPRPACDEDEEEVEMGRAKDSTLGELRVLLASKLDVPVQQVMISQVKVSERSKASCVVVVHSSKDKLTLEQLKLCDGDKLAAEASTKKGMKTLAHSLADKQNNLLSVIVEDRCSPHLSDTTSYPVHAMEVAKDSLISTFKSAILSRLQIPSVEGGGRLRVDEECLGPPLHEEQTLDTAGVGHGHRIVLEPGQPPTSSQLVLRCKLSSGSKEWEVTVEGGATVAECCQLMAHSARLQGEQWHLQRTNWCGEVADVLEDETAMLCKESLKSGELLLIEEGKLPPKNFVRVSVSLFTPSYPTCVPSYLTDSSLATGLLSWVMDSATIADEQGFTHDDDFPRVDPNEVPLHLQSPAHFYPGLSGCLIGLDSIETHRDSTIEDLKALILTLPALSGAVVPTLNFLRLREVVDGRLGKVFKNPQQTLRRNKLVTGSHVCVTVLEYEETLPATAIVFHVQARIPGRRSYGPAAEVVYDASRSTKPSELVKLVANLVQLDVSLLRVAKHKLESFEWIVFRDNYNKESGKKKKSKGAAANIKNSPICLRDGDTLGMKSLQYDPEDSDDFTTAGDDRGKEILTAIQEEKRRN